MANIVAYAIAVIAVLAAAVLYRLETFEAAAYPEHELTRVGAPALVAAKRNERLLRGSEKIGEGKLVGPEDIAYDPKTGVIYTGGEDGWISRVSVTESVVEKWVNTGGRPLGIVHGVHGEVIVADAYKFFKLLHHTLNTLNTPVASPQAPPGDAARTTLHEQPDADASESVTAPHPPCVASPLTPLFSQQQIGRRSTPLLR